MSVELGNNLENTRRPQFISTVSPLYHYDSVRYSLNLKCTSTDRYSSSLLHITKSQLTQLKSQSTMK